METENENEIEVSAKKMESDGYQNTNNSQKDPKKLSRMQKASLYIKAFFKFFTVEPILLCYILPNAISLESVKKLNTTKACLLDLNKTVEICHKGRILGNKTIDALDDVSEMISWRQPLQTSIPAIMILFVGAWSDRTGNRKALMFIPMIGQIITSILMISTVYYFLEWPSWVTGLIEVLPSALSGGLSTTLVGSYSYIADTTSVDSRTFRIGVIGVTVALSVSLGAFLGEVVTQFIGYYGIFGIGFVLHIIGFVYTYYRIHNVRKTRTETIQERTIRQNVVQFFHPRNVWDTLSLLVMARGPKLAQISLIIWAHVVLICPIFGEINLTYFRPTSKDGGTTVAVFLFSKNKMHDALLGIIATASMVVSCFFYALASTKGWSSGPVFDLFGFTGVTATRSLGTKVVKPTEVGKMSSLIEFIDALVPMVYTAIYNKIGINTTKTVTGMFYMVAGGMVIPAFFIFTTLYILHKIHRRREIKDTFKDEIEINETVITAI